MTSTLKSRETRELEHHYSGDRIAGLVVIVGVAMLLTLLISVYFAAVVW